ncbi:MAG: succinate-semialdehyde dehydrogenase (NADP(+)) [Planctomycetota bacterium]|nr:MAG: succinate-semialdehyde dehydrogenase (NADP(+)) [Planctomycetota bacterium]
MKKTLSEKLFKEKCFINGEWVNADSGQKDEITNPSDLSILGSVPRMGEAETTRAVEAANEAFKVWQAKTGKERSIILRKWFDLIMSHQEDLATILTMEQGKPHAEAKGEIAYAASFIEWFAEEAKRVNGDILPSPLPGKKIVILKQPIGVVAAITPWNFPAAMITRKCAPALAVGCPVVIKPAPDTPFTALALCELSLEAGFPPGVINCVTGDAVAIGKILTSHPLVRKLTFTGSTGIGKLLLSQCASTVKKVSLELGGNAPFIVFEDADLDEAVKGAMISKFRNTGQTCVCTNRFFVHEKVYDTFCQKLKAVVSNLKIGDGFEEGVEQGPLINMNAVKKIESHIADAKEKGAKVLIGGKRIGDKGTFFEPTIITGVTSDMMVTQDETFGPLAAIIKFNDEDEVIRLANDTPYGLAAYFYSKDLGRVWRVSESLEYGMIGVNEGMISNEIAPFGGVKESGLGREGSKYGTDDFLEIKYIMMGGLEK